MAESINKDCIGDLLEGLGVYTDSELQILLVRLKGVLSNSTIYNIRKKEACRQKLENVIRDEIIAYFDDNLSKRVQDDLKLEQFDNFVSLLCNNLVDELYVGEEEALQNERINEIVGGVIGEVKSVIEDRLFDGLYKQNLNRFFSSDGLGYKYFQNIMKMLGHDFDYIEEVRLGCLQSLDAYKCSVRLARLSSVKARFVETIKGLILFKFVGMGEEVLCALGSQINDEVVGMVDELVSVLELKE